MDIRKLTVIRAKLSRHNLVRFRLNCAKNNEMSIGILKRLDLKIEENETHPKKNIYNNYILVYIYTIYVYTIYKEIYLIRI